MDSASWGAKVVSRSRVFKPAGLGPFPVALILHGCGGKTPFLETYAEVAVKAGYAAIVLDSFAPRGMSTLDGKLFVCTLMTLHGAKRAADIFATLAWLKTQSWARADQVFLAGWSHGAWTIMDAYAAGTSAPSATGLADADAVALRKQVKGALLVYPYAAYPSMTSRRGWGPGAPPVWSVLGQKDGVVGWRYPKKALERLSADGVKVDLKLYPDATHAFDDDKANDPRAIYRPDLFQEVQDYFAAALKAVAPKPGLFA
ncbi:dienelactone hydrolase [Caulobacter sp. D4A]|uniref:dienelactone hydrolase family protein n=1 Tax=unclassified Caulobacter TaxID=2648921 RepID=UPI000D73CD69|nr:MULTISPECIES: dienelactone hydrolase family protein [unclassified Caulobacter]PXA91144.1 dienelactone hydrolase [Caulobacter sp. D4A]PXA95242.1 dienelactone hydrolase [Caulobacter sp. D5]